MSTGPLEDSTAVAAVDTIEQATADPYTAAEAVGALLAAGWRLVPPRRATVLRDSLPGEADLSRLDEGPDW